MPGLAGAFWSQTEQHSGCGAASPSQGHRDPDSLRAALSLGGEAPARECSLGRFLSLGKSSPPPWVWGYFSVLETKVIEFYFILFFTGENRNNIKFTILT